MNMTTKEKLEAIRQACIKANPEIVELKFGCLISGFGHHRSPVVCLDKDYTAFLHAPTLITNDKTKNVQANYEIIGRPIRLADVLLALHRTSRTQNVSINTLVGTMMNHNFTRDDLNKHWDFYKDSLDEQPEETISFIYELLK